MKVIFVDPLVNHGWVLRGRAVESCHLFASPADQDELHALAVGIGLRRAWFQLDGGARRVPHYDLTPGRRAAAVQAGAVELSRHEAVAFWREHYPVGGESTST